MIFIVAKEDEKRLMDLSQQKGFKAFLLGTVEESKKKQWVSPWGEV